ncbi:MAG: bifunctional phosphoribosylaminoimidazolecarboxamide formyltransferase/IMP cyclohydrolase [Chitinophagales bacterium]
MKKVKTALISVFYKDGLENLLPILKQHNITIYTTGGTQQFIEDLGYHVVAVETLTDYPSILGGRVKTLHPKVFGGILARRENQSDIEELQQYQIPEIDLVIVDLYPFEETVATTNDEATIIEKIDIGGISLIRAAAKNYKDTVIVSQKNQYQTIASLLETQEASTSLEQRKLFAKEAFALSSHYDIKIYDYLLCDETANSLKISETEAQSLRYGENPHQKASYFGNLNEDFEVLSGKELSYNNIVDIDAAVRLIQEFTQPTFVVVKHTNACGVASDDNLLEAWNKALAGDPVSAFGGILACNGTVDVAIANAMNGLFFEVLIAKDFTSEALDILTKKKNRRILKQKNLLQNKLQIKSILNGFIIQNYDDFTDTEQNLKVVSNEQPTTKQINDLLFAAKIVKHLKSNTIVLAKNNQLLAMGCGQTSRVDALQQAIAKAKQFNFDLNGAVMASDAFFPFPDCVEIAYNAGIKAVLHPGGSIKDQDSIDFCNQHQMAMVLTGIRHFKH